jgi:hypothetical protein
MCLYVFYISLPLVRLNFKFLLIQGWCPDFNPRVNGNSIEKLNAWPAGHYALVTVVM